MSSPQVQLALSTWSVPPIPASNADTPMTRKHVLQVMRNEKLRIPDLAPYFCHWPSRTHPELEKLRVDVEDWLDRILPPSKAPNAFKASDFGLFGATWWPCASSIDRLKIVTYIAIWLFIWDDEIDTAAGSMWEDWEAAQKFRLDTIEYVQYCLGLGPTDQKKPEPKSPMILAFNIIGFAIRDACTLGQRQMFYDEIDEFMKQSEREQRFRLNNDHLPSMSEFWSYRLGASAVFICLAVNEYAYADLELPAEVFQDADMKEIWQLTNIIISAVNDILSLKKEIAHDAVDSVIPIMYVQLGNVQAAMNETVEFIASMIKRFDDAEARLLERYRSADDGLQIQLRKFITGAKYYCTGNLTWSLQTKRYGVNEE